MKRMGIDPEMSLAEAVELYPQSFPLFKQLGICCVNEENETWSVQELCSRFGVDAESFVDAVNRIL